MVDKKSKRVRFGLWIKAIRNICDLNIVRNQSLLMFTFPSLKGSH